MTKDPMLLGTSDRGRELFQKISEAIDGFPSDDVINAAANLVINALRGVHPTRESAERSFDEIFGRTKQLLMDHYDSLGRKRGVFPYNQTIRVPFMNLSVKDPYIGNKN